MDAKSPAFLAACYRLSLDPALCAAIVSVESGWNPWVCRFEPQFKWTWQVEEYGGRLGITDTTERNLQKTSWGLMQIMGGTARELGYDGQLTALCLAEIGLDWGLRYLAKKVKMHNQLTDQIAAYNAGNAKREASGRYKNQGYIDKVLSAMAQQRAPRVPA